jgi:hypothetical protein
MKPVISQVTSDSISDVISSVITCISIIACTVKTLKSSPKAPPLGFFRRHREIGTGGVGETTNHDNDTHRGSDSVFYSVTAYSDREIGTGGTGVTSNHDNDMHIIILLLLSDSVLYSLI